MFIKILKCTNNKSKCVFSSYYTACAHPKYSKNEGKSREWMEMGSPPHEFLKKVIMQSQLVKDMKKMSENASTSAVEIFHALKIRYLPKSIFYEKEKMMASTKLAILDHNLNVERGQVSF